MSDFQTQQASLSQSQALAAAIQRAKQVRRSIAGHPSVPFAQKTLFLAKLTVCINYRLPQKYNQISSHKEEEVVEGIPVDPPPEAAEVATVISGITMTPIVDPIVNAPLAVLTTVKITRT